MSGAEAAFVLGVISSIIAIIDGTKKVYEAATNAEGLPAAFSEVANRLPMIKGILGSAKEQVEGGRVDASTCKAITFVVRACEEKAKRLDAIFHKVLPSDDASPLGRYFKAVRTLGKGSRVEDLMKGMLEDVQLLADNHSMGVIKSNQAEHIMKAIEDISEIEPSVPESEFQETSFANNHFGSGAMTNYNVQGDQYTQTNSGLGKSFQGSGMTFNFENEQVNNQGFNAMTQNFYASQSVPSDADKNTAREDKVLYDLEFDGMNERYDDISQAHRQTFRWIYERPELKFVEWLRGGKGTYWISGKAGSGKSTLMKLLYEDPRTHELLPRDTSHTLVAGFFFHDRGENPLLKSQEGLFRAIIYHILANYPQLIPIALPKYWEATKYDHTTVARPLNRSSWLLAELKAAFKAIVTQQVVNLRLCLIIDGLDEFSGNDKDLIDTLTDLSNPAHSMARIQLCISSRPEVIFEKTYSQFWHLKMQELTAEDINIYVTTKFNEDYELKNLVLEDPITSNQIKEEILSKAEGVFLWVTLVVSSLVEGLEYADNLQSLQRRLKALPAGLKPLFKRMIEEIDPLYHEEAALLFEMVQCASLPLSPLAVYFTYEKPNIAPSKKDVISDSEIQKWHCIVAKRLKARSAGLIEMTSAQSHKYMDSSKEQTTPWQPSKVQYLHLTVKEFFASEQLPAWISEEKAKGLFNPHTKIVASCLQQFRATGSLHLYDYRKEIKEPYQLGSYVDATNDGIIFMIISHAVQVEHSTRTSQLAYLDELDELVLYFASLSPLPSTEDKYAHAIQQLHWTARRYNDWAEPEGWCSDYLSYLITIGMTQTVINKLNNGYRPSMKSGRPLLLYATTSLPPDYAIGDIERDTVDPEMVEALLQRDCNPNKPFLSLYEHDIRDGGTTRTVWESALLQLWQRFCTSYAKTADSRWYHQQLKQNDQATHNLMLRWLKTVKIFLDYNADSTVFVIESSKSNRESSRFKRSALFIFNKVFSDFNHPLVTTIRNLMISNGAKEIEEDLYALESRNKDNYTVESHKGVVRHLPSISKAFKKWKGKRV